MDPKSFFIDTVLITKLVVLSQNLLISGLAASTSDIAYGQTIGNTLKDRTPGVWSSTGSATSDKREWLCYKMVTDLCILRGVKIITAKDHNHFR